jgi:hypothetical protein
MFCRDNIDALIGAVGGRNRRELEVKGVCVIHSAGRVRVFFVEPFD